MEKKLEYLYERVNNETISTVKAVKSCPISNSDGITVNEDCERGIACQYEHGSDYQLKYSEKELGYGTWSLQWNDKETAKVQEKCLDKGSKIIPDLLFIFN